MKANLLQGWNSYHICFLLVALLLPFRVTPQCDTTVVTSIQCESAPFLCLSELCVTSVIEPFNCCNGFCGANTAIHNPQFFAFIANDDEVIIEIDVDNCSSGNGMQSAILDACPWDNSNVLACDPGTPPGGIMMLHATGLTPGNTYWLLMDGTSGATCQYVIRAQSGVDFNIPAPDLILDMTSISDTLLCAGMQDVTIEVGSTTGNSANYYWHTPWNNDTIITLDSVLILDIALDAAPGNWDICIWADNGCDTSNMICIPVIIDTFETVSLGVSSFCPEEFPFAWGNVIIDGPGTYTGSFQGADGCRTDSTWTVLEYPEVEQGYIDTIVCDFEFNYEGEYFDNSGIYDRFYPGQGSNGCDSFAILDLTLQYFEFFVEIDEDANGAFLNPFITQQLGQFDTFQYSWFTCDTALISTGENYRLDSSGCYCLMIEGGVCSYFTCATYEVGTLPDSCDLVPGDACVGDDVVFRYEGDPSDVISYDWIVQVSSSGAVQHASSSTVSRAFNQVGTYHVSLTITDSTRTFTCHDSVHINPEFFVAFDQQEDTLVALPDSAEAYSWRVCGNGEVMATTSYFVADTSGCYCVDVEIGGCVVTECTDFIIVGIDRISSPLAGIHPNPSKGVWQVSLYQSVNLPVQWSLINTLGVSMESGDITAHQSTIRLQRPIAGAYYLQLTNKDGFTSLHKVLLE